MDWFAVTFPDGTDPIAVFPGAEPLEWVELPRGGYHYSRANASGKLRVYHGGEPGMGVHSVMSGKACRQAEAQGLIRDGGRVALPEGLGIYGCLTEGSGSTAPARPPDWPAYWRWVIDQGGAARRLDAALDDRAGVLDLDRIEGAWLAGAMSSHYKRLRRIKEHDDRGRLTGDTIYVGSRDSGSSVRIYNKALEQGLPAGEHWIRVEVEFRGERADRAMRVLAECQAELLGKAIAELLRGLLRFVKGERSRRHRDQLVEWWAEFLGDVASRRLGSDPKVYSVEELELWLGRQCAPSIAVVLAARGGDMACLHELAAEGRRRWRPHHRAMIASAA